MELLAISIEYIAIIGIPRRPWANIIPIAQIPAGQAQFKRSLKPNAKFNSPIERAYIMNTSFLEFPLVVNIDKKNDAGSKMSKIF